jgi:putative oxidoreductase
MVRRILDTRNDYSLTIARLILGVVFFAHGAQKVLGWFGGHGFSASLAMFTGKMHIPLMLALLPIAAEFLGSLGLIVGFLGRIASFGIMCDMAVAVAMVHSHIGFFMNWAGTQRGEGYEFHLLALGLGAVILIKGSGALSIDRWLTGRSSSDVVRIDHPAVRRTA